MNIVSTGAVHAAARRDSRRTLCKPGQPRPEKWKATAERITCKSCLAHIADAHDEAERACARWENRTVHGTSRQVAEVNGFTYQVAPGGSLVVFDKRFDPDGVLVYQSLDVDADSAKRHAVMDVMPRFGWKTKRTYRR